jgi:adenylosuccinate lyase
LAKVIHNLSQFALKYKDLPTLGFTYVSKAHHFQSLAICKC